MRQKLLIATSLVLATAATGCSTKLAVSVPEKVQNVGGKQIPVELKSPEKVGGIPFREAKSHMVHLYAYDKAKKQYTLISSETRVIASPDEVFYLSTDREMLSDSKLAIKLRANGTLETVNVSSTNRILGTADAVIGEVDKLATDAEARETAAEAQAKAERDAKLACVEARVGLNIAEEALDALTYETPAIDRVRAEGDVLIAEVKQRNACILE